MIPTDKVHIITVELLWPVTQLWPNRPGHYHKKAAAKKQARNDARYATMAANQMTTVSNTDKLFATWDFHTPNSIRRDTGNMRAAMKAAQDGVFDAIAGIGQQEIDDSQVHVELLRRAENIKGGLVVLNLYRYTDDS